MKNIVLFTIVLLFVPLVKAVGHPAMTVKMEKYDPIPVEPGNAFDVWIGFDNKGSSSEQIRVRPVSAFPFIPITESVEVGVVPENEKVLAHFLIKTDVTALSKDYNLTFEYQQGDTKWWIQTTSSIQVRTAGASVSIQSYELSPKEIAPGGIATLTLLIENTGRTTVKDIDIDIDLQNTFSPIGSGTIKRLAALLPGEKESVSFSLVADPAAEPRMYTFPLVLSYSDDRNNKYTKSMSVSAGVNAVPDILLIVDDISRNEEEITVTLKVINRGTIPVKYVTGTLLPGTYTLQSPAETKYLGNIDSDDFEQISWTFSTQGNTLSLPVEVTYKDSYNKDFTKTQTITIPVPKIVKTSRKWQAIGGVLLVLLVGYCWLRRKKK